MVGAVGFEPTASCSQSRRAARLRHAPVSSRLRFLPVDSIKFRVMQEQISVSMTLN